ncbi:hypothetical protein U1Q18_051592 [Sarracenia purpurea var. burkii]
MLLLLDDDDNDAAASEWRGMEAYRSYEGMLRPLLGCNLAVMQQHLGGGVPLLEDRERGVVLMELMSSLDDSGRRAGQQHQRRRDPDGPDRALRPESGEYNVRRARVVAHHQPEAAQHAKRRPRLAAAPQPQQRTGMRLAESTFVVGVTGCCDEHHQLPRLSGGLAPPRQLRRDLQ